MNVQLGEVGTTPLFEDDHVKVWHLVLEGEQATPWHEHMYDYIYVVVESGNVREESLDGTSQEQSDVLGATVFKTRDGIHRLVNLGKSRYTNIVIELKNGNHELHAENFRNS